MHDVVTPPVFTVMFMKEFMLFTAVPMKKFLMIIIYGNDDLGDLGDLDDPDDDLVGPTHDLVQYLQAGLAAQGPWESPSADGGGGKLPPRAGRRKLVYAVFPSLKVPRVSGPDGKRAQIKLEDGYVKPADPGILLQVFEVFKVKQ